MIQPVKNFVMQSLIDLGTPVDSWVATYLLVCSSDEEIREILDIYSVEEINTFLGTIYTKDEVDDFRRFNYLSNRKKFYIQERCRRLFL